MTPADASKLPREFLESIAVHASNYAKTRGQPAGPAHYAKLREALRWASQWAAIEDEPREGCVAAQNLEQAA